MRIYLTLLITFILLTGCGTGQQIAELKQQADDYRTEGKLDEAIVLYEKILDIKEDSEVGAVLDDTRYEQESVKRVKEFRDTLYDIQKNRLRSGIKVRPTEMEYIIKDLKRAIEDFERIDTDRDTQIANYVNKVKNDVTYTILMTQIDHTIFDDDSGLTEGLTKLDESFNQQTTLYLAFERGNIKDGINKILEINIPNKYNK